jgi:hypothetical protein
MISNTFGCVAAAAGSEAVSHKMQSDAVMKTRAAMAIPIGNSVRASYSNDGNGFYATSGEESRISARARN